jgi:uncharacterized membrane protein YsdA (DUF1294 family)
MPLNYMSVLLGLLVAINIAGFFIAAADKRKAAKKRRRIPEKWFFLLSLMGGCPGVYAGLLIFRHKTRHWYFMWGIPAIFALQLGILLFLFIVQPA